MTCMPTPTYRRRPSAHLYPRTAPHLPIEFQPVRPNQESPRKRPNLNCRYAVRSHDEPREALNQRTFLADPLIGMRFA